MRPVCDASHTGKWSAAKTLLINDFCNLPKDPQFGFSGVQTEFKWDLNVFESNTSYYQVEYGLEGFSLGNGTRTNLNNNYYSGMSLQAGQIYDFYVRSYCNSSLGWSSWVCPITHLSVGNQNLCLPPTSVNYEVQSISGSYATINFQWDSNGENTSEYALVGHNETPTTATIHTIAAGTGTPTYPTVYRYSDYDFCVRNICQDGSRTAWTRKLVDL
ncbi:hypothetical protein [Flavobacterium sp. 3HN19-14]|uniref:hypothetical protein n=1 Tax=Flavobacterium sp. 3HN19-14 TaxID=3448133 RepID=UPI003EE34C3E